MMSRIQRHAMSSHSSFSQNSQLKDFKEQMNKIKSPFLQKIKTSAQTFQTKIKAFEQKLNSQQECDIQQNEKVLQQVSQKYHQNQLDTQENLNDKQFQEAPVTIQLDASKTHKKNKSSEFPLSFMKQWIGNSQFAFTNMQEVKQNFINVFNKKLGVKKKQGKQKMYDFKQDQKNMLINIFHQIQNAYGPDKGFASIQRIVQFFQENQLFYLFYNLHPNRLKYDLKQFARTRPNSLTQRQFLHVFFMDRPLLKDLSDPYQKIVHRKCILDSEGWQELKTIFNTLDTFGNETIHIRPFFQKIKTYHSNPNLIFTPVIEFPQIQRVYTLKKVVFDLEHKFQFKNKIQWKDIENVILNFNHKEQPTLDIIFQNYLEKATILLDSNYFLIDKKIISILKNIFERCPKFSQFFVNTKFVCNEILQNQDLKPYYKNPIRQKTHLYGGYINLQESVRYLAAKAPQYIDLDEFLQYFSIKGPITNVLLQNHTDVSSSEQQDQNEDQRKKMLKRMRSLQRLEISRKNKKPKRQVRQVTDFQQFNLTKKQKQTIRQKKVKQMLHQRQQEQMKQLRKKFKANPIPADLNPQRLREQQKRMQMRKKKKLEEIAKRRQQDKQILSYLKANTRLFEPLNKQTEQTAQNNNLPTKSPIKTFTHKPIPWFVHEHLLDKIERQKSQRKKKLHEQARLRYVRSWNKLPDFFFKEQQQQNSAQNSIIRELRNKNFEGPKVQIKANPVPDFKSLHKQFQEELQKKKKQFHPTQIKEFNLTSPKAHKKQSHSQYLSPQQRNSDQSRWRQTLHSPPANKISTTKKVQEWMEYNKKIQQQKKASKQQEKQKQKQKIAKQKNFAKFMSKKLREQDRNMPDLQAQTAQKLNRHKQTVQYLQRMTQKQLSQIYAKVLQRPFLFETASTQAGTKKQYKKGNNGQKLVKKGVVKNIEPIDMSQESSNKYNQFKAMNNGHHVQQYQGQNSEYSDNPSRHEALNQSF